MTESEAQRHWSIDRRVPIVVIVGLVVQFAGAVWWASATAEKLANHERRIGQIEEGVKPLDARLARIETMLEIVLSKIDRDDRRP